MSFDVRLYKKYKRLLGGYTAEGLMEAFQDGRKEGKDTGDEHSFINQTLRMNEAEERLTTLRALIHQAAARERIAMKLLDKGYPGHIEDMVEQVYAACQGRRVDEEVKNESASVSGLFGTGKE